MLCHLPWLPGSEPESSSLVLASLVSPKEKDLLSPEPALLKAGEYRAQQYTIVFYFSHKRNDSGVRNFYSLFPLPSFYFCIIYHVIFYPFSFCNKKTETSKKLKARNPNAHTLMETLLRSIYGSST